jgi:hypothetical protein
VVTITTTLRLADDTTAPITIRRRGPCSMWSAVTIDSRPPYICKRGHIIAGTNARTTRNGYQRCHACQRYNDRLSKQRRKQNSVLTPRRDS